MNKKPTELVLILHNIRSVHNVGAIFRTADAAGVSKVYLSGYTPTPIDRFNRKRRDFAKSALGAEESVAWEQKDIEMLQDELKACNFEIVALEQDTTSLDYKEYVPKEKFALVLGNEPNGIEKSILEQMDTILEIPMKGEKESLNVSVAAGIAMYRILDR
jgi:tRNA G18 (ribose-2'-O)-methylase SpoU